MENFLLNTDEAEQDVVLLLDTVKHFMFSPQEYIPTIFLDMLWLANTACY